MQKGNLKIIYLLILALLLIVVVYLVYEKRIKDLESNIRIQTP